MASETLPEPPAQLKAIQAFMRIASDVDRVDPVVSYWVRLYCTETALAIDRESPECKAFLGEIILWLEKFKQAHKGNDTVSNQTVGQAHFENFVVALFNKADTLDRDGVANKSTVRMFYMAAVLFESMSVFGPLTDEISKKAKYAKFKAAYIQKCLKLGQTPKPGPIEGSDLENPGDDSTAGESANPPGAPTMPSMPTMPTMPTMSTPSTLPASTESKTTNQDPYIMTPSSPPTYPKPPQAPSVSSDTPTKQSKSNPSDDQRYPMPSATTQSSSSTANSSSCGVSATDTSGASTIAVTKFQATNGAPLNAEDLIQSQKFCKFANSALQYDDIPTAVSNLEKALKLLTLGQRST